MTSGKKRLVQGIALLLGMIMMVSATQPLTAFAAPEVKEAEAVTKTEGKNAAAVKLPNQTVYYAFENGVNYFYPITPEGNAKPTNIKSSNTKVLERYYLRTATDTLTEKEYDWQDDKGVKYPVVTKSYAIAFDVKGTGKTTVSYKVGKKTYKQTITVKKLNAGTVSWKNPIKSITLSGVNKGKNFASKYKNTNAVKVSVASDQTDAKLNITLKNNCAFSRVAYYDGVSNKTMGLQKVWDYSYADIRTGVYNIGVLTKAKGSMSKKLNPNNMIDAYYTYGYTSMAGKYGYLTPKSKFIVVEYTESVKNTDGSTTRYLRYFHILMNK